MRKEQSMSAENTGTNSENYNEITINSATAHDGAGQEVSAEKQAAAVRAWAEYWGSECPDCGPQDYEFMLKHALDKP